MKKLIRYLMNFLKNGFAVFSASSHGHYNQRSTPIKEFREEMLHCGKRTIINDKVNLKKDQKSIARDVRTSISKLAVENG